jgi:excisionase family DNA binding protein
MEMEGTNGLLRPREAAEMLAVSPRTLRRYIADGHVPIRRLPSGHVRIRQAVIAALMGEEESSSHAPRRRRDVPRPSAARHLAVASAGPSGRRLPLSKAQPPALLFDTSPRALAEAREMAA